MSPSLWTLLRRSRGEWRIIIQGYVNVRKIMQSHYGNRIQLHCASFHCIFISRVQNNFFFDFWKVLLISGVSNQTNDVLNFISSVYCAILTSNTSAALSSCFSWSDYTCSYSPFDGPLLSSSLSSFGWFLISFVGAG